MNHLKHWVELLPTDYVTFLIDCHHSHVVHFGKQRLVSGTQWSSMVHYGKQRLVGGTQWSSMVHYGKKWSSRDQWFSMDHYGNQQPGMVPRGSVKWLILVCLHLVLSDHSCSTPQPSEVEIMTNPWSSLTNSHGVVLYFCQPDPEAMWRLRGTYR